MGEWIRRGICSGGPLSGEFAESRFPKGFLLVDKPKNQAWIYEWDETSQCFIARNETPMELNHAGRMRAANEFTYDVVAAPWGGVE